VIGRGPEEDFLGHGSDQPPVDGPYRALGQAAGADMGDGVH
jgi:hypothetical protein